MTSRTFGDLGELFDGPHATPTRRDTGPYFLNISSLSAGRLDLDLSDHVSPEDFSRWTRRVTPQEGDLLFSYETRLGEAALMPAGIDACLGRRMALLRPNRDIADPRFLLYMYLGPQFQNTIVERSVHGATVSRIPLKTMESWPVELPTLPEQRAIAEVLGALDDKIAANRTSLSRAGDLVQAKAVQASRGGSARTLSEVAEFISRGVAPRYVEEDGLVVLNQKCIRGARVSLQDARQTEPLSGRKLDKVLKPGDSLVNSTGQGTLGRVAQWSLDMAATVDSHVSIVRWNPELADPFVAGSLLLQRERDVEALAEGSTGQTELKRDHLGALPIVLPDIETQRRVGQDIKELVEFQNQLDDENHKLATTRDGLLPLLMSGKLRVKDAEQQIGEVV